MKIKKLKYAVLPLAIFSSFTFATGSEKTTEYNIHDFTVVHVVDSFSNSKYCGVVKEKMTIYTFGIHEGKRTDHVMPMLSVKKGKDNYFKYKVDNNKMVTIQGASHYDPENADIYRKLRQTKELVRQAKAGNQLEYRYKYNMFLDPISAKFSLKGFTKAFDLATRCNQKEIETYLKSLKKKKESEKKPS